VRLHALTAEEKMKKQPSPMPRPLVTAIRWFGAEITPARNAKTRIAGMPMMRRMVRSMLMLRRLILAVALSKGLCAVGAGFHDVYVGMK